MSLTDEGLVFVVQIGAQLIIAITRTGLTANALAKFFSSVPVMVLTTSPQVCAQVLLHRSVTPYLVASLQRESCVPRAISKATELGLVSTGSRVLLLTGKDDMIANRLETFVVGEGVMPPLTTSHIPTVHKQEHESQEDSIEDQGAGAGLKDQLEQQKSM